MKLADCVTGGPEEEGQWLGHKGVAQGVYGLSSFTQCFPHRNLDSPLLARTGMGGR